MSFRNLRLTAKTTAQGSTILISNGSDAHIDVAAPVLIDVLGHGSLSSGYDVVENENGALIGRKTASLADGSTIEVSDSWRADASLGDTVGLTRTVRVSEVGTGEGIRVALSSVTGSHASDAEAWQFYLPGTLYNRNDNDQDGKEDYLGTYVQDLRDDKNGVLGALAYLPDSSTAFTIARTTIPEFDTAVSPEDLGRRFFVQKTDIGSTGLAPAGKEIELRASWPFSEENSFSLDTAGSGWAAYAPIKPGQLFEVSYQFRIAAASDLTEAIWEFFEHQRRELKTARPIAPLTLDEAVEHRQMLTQLYYRKWEKEENAKEPAGYLVHFSPRNGDTLGSLLEFGFSGDQTLLAYVQLQWGYDEARPIYRNRARSVINFFVKNCLLDNGYAHGIYDPINDRFTHWFTGILMPFQYATDEEDVRRYVGRQIASALMPVARELRKVEGNYLRTMCESFYPILRAYELDIENGVENSEWLQACKKFGQFLLSTQSGDGSWYRAYDTHGNGLTHPAAWFGASEVEQKSGTIFPIQVLTVLHRLTGEPVYSAAIARAADYIISTFVEPVAYVGGLNDTTHIKSVKTDSVGVMFLMRSLLFAYDVTGDPKHLQGAVKAAKILASWVYLWDVPFPKGTLMDQGGFKSTGWAVCDVIASGSYLDNEFLEFTGDLARVAHLANEPALLDIAELVEHGMQLALSTPDVDYGYIAPGIQCEGVLTSYWLSAPDTTEFSGAVNKVKGDDNDTCNALTNGQAAYGIYELRKAFGTTDFDEIRAVAFAGVTASVGS